MKKMVMLAAILLAACARTRIEPVDIAGGDMCSFCRMAISEKRVATEFWSKEAALFKFDDAGCMLNFIRKENLRPDIHACFVMDYEARRWLKAEEAYFVRSARIKTPMGGGIIAFGDKAQAEAAASRYQGQVVRFDRLFEPQLAFTGRTPAACSSILDLRSRIEI